MKPSVMMNMSRSFRSVLLLSNSQAEKNLAFCGKASKLLPKSQVFIRLGFSRRI